MWWSPHPPLIMMNNSPYLHICQLSLVSCLHLYTVNKSFTVFPLCTRPTCPQSKERVLNNCFSFSLSPSKVFLLYSTFFLAYLSSKGRMLSNIIISSYQVSNLFDVYWSLPCESEIRFLSTQIFHVNLQNENDFGKHYWYIC